jgi:dTDP-4-dehydrorhamnose 3,5-epimerase-like enzyme
VRETRFDLLPDVVVFEPDLHGDDRGFLFESYRECDFEQAVGGHRRFVQDNHSRSRRGVLRQGRHSWSASSWLFPSKCPFRPNL